VVRYAITPPDERDPLYIPIASFITAYARQTTIQAVQANYERFVYCDTDSIHLIGDEDPVGVPVHQSDLGAWKHEFIIKQGKFLRAKCYMEIGHEVKADGSVGKLVKKVTVSGMGDKLHKYVTLDNFKLGTRFSVDGDGVQIAPEDANLRPVRVKNGIVLIQKDFTLQI
jgi:hypothetical protein